MEGRRFGSFFLGSVTSERTFEVWSVIAMIDSFLDRLVLGSVYVFGLRGREFDVLPLDKEKI